MEAQFENAVAEIKEATNVKQKTLLLQKYGIMEPRLTRYEKDLIAFEAHCIKKFGTEFEMVRLGRKGATV